MTIELKDAAGAETLIEAIDAYKVRLMKSFEDNRKGRPAHGLYDALENQL